MHLAVREDRPYSYAGAFEKPVPHAEDGGYVEASLTALAAHAKATARFLGPARTPRFEGYASLHTKDLPALGEHLDGIDDLVTAAITAALPAGQPR